MAIKHVAFVMYPVTDMARAIAFYQDGLGFVKAGLESDTWVEFEVGGTTFGIGNFEQIGKPGTAQSLAIEVADLEGFRKELAAKGIASTDAYETPVCFLSLVKDPDGNQLWLHACK